MRYPRENHAGTVSLSLLVAGLLLLPAEATGLDAWTCHVVDDRSNGADGVRLADVNGDGRPDVATGWEEGGRTRVYLNPGVDEVGEPWPAVTVGRAPSVEDAVLVDLDGDGRHDVVSATEGSTRTVLLHYAPERVDRYLDPEAWRTLPIESSRDVMMWMYTVPMDVDGRRGIDLIVGGKGVGAGVGWWESPESPRETSAWQWHPITSAGWIMSLRSVDMDDDGDQDVLLSDRRGAMRGVRWLENPGASLSRYLPWPNHFVGGRDQEAMFLDRGDLDGDGRPEIVCAVKGHRILVFSAGADSEWDMTTIDVPAEAGSGKGVAVGDVDLDGRSDVVFTCEGASGDRPGVMWLSHDGDWSPRTISDGKGEKFDRVELLDLDADGDLDVLTCEERYRHPDGRRGLGVIWYENPTR